jgi:hypothetical protein
VLRSLPRPSGQEMDGAACEGERSAVAIIFFSLFCLLSLPRACHGRFPQPVTYATYRRGKTRLSLKGQKKRVNYNSVQLSAVTDLMPTTLAESNSLLLLPSLGSRPAYMFCPTCGVQTFIHSAHVRCLSISPREICLAEPVPAKDALYWTLSREGQMERSNAPQRPSSPTARDCDTSAYAIKRPWSP